jgi:KDO2-lipid IV(A) lauroyltransferase
LLRGALALLRHMGVVRASNFGGWLGRSLGPWLPVSRVAEANLRRALPALAPAERADVIRSMWDNLGRNLGELPHLGALRRCDSGPGWYCADDAVAAALRERGGPALLFSAHFGNWEMILPLAAALGLPLAGFYRAASNPLSDALIQTLRRQAIGGQAAGAPVVMFPKGARGARAAVLHLGRGGMLGMLADQKLDDGIAVDFFGAPAMTAPALAQLALRYRCPVVPARIRRLGPARFELILEPSLALPDSGDRESDVLTLTREVNATLERWIRAEPAAWLWVHRRWPVQT